MEPHQNVLWLKGWQLQSSILTFCLKLFEFLNTATYKTDPFAKITMVQKRMKAPIKALAGPSHPLPMPDACRIARIVLNWGAKNPRQVQHNTMPISVRSRFYLLCLHTGMLSIITSHLRPLIVCVALIFVSATLYSASSHQRLHFIRWTTGHKYPNHKAFDKAAGDTNGSTVNTISSEEWFRSQNLKYPFRYSYRAITTRPAPGLRRHALTKLNATLFDNLATVNSIEDISDVDTQSLFLEVPTQEKGPVNASHLSFGIQTTISRLENSVPQLVRWLANTNAKLSVVLLEAETIPVHVSQMVRLETRMRNQGIDVTLSPAHSGDTFPQRYFSLVNIMYQQRSPQTQWVSLIDDDTFFPSMPALLAMLDKYDAREQHYVGSLSEDWWAVSHYGLMGFGGAGIFLSLPLAEVLAVHTDTCKDNLRSSAGDITVMDCIYTYTSTKLTPVGELHQHDIQGDPSGLYESGRRHLSLHHWKAGSVMGKALPMTAMHLVTDVCGDCFLQRWQFANDTVLSNGFSIGTYPKGHVKNGTQNSVNMDHMEETWNNNMDVRNSLGPTRPRLTLEDEKIQYIFLNATIVDGGVRQLYFHKGIDEDPDTVLDLFWRAEKPG